MDKIIIENAISGDYWKQDKHMDRMGPYDKVLHVAGIDVITPGPDSVRLSNAIQIHGMDKESALTVRAEILDALALVSAIRRMTDNERR